jgi:ribosome recycling factor
MSENLLAQAREKMQKTLEHLREELAGVHTGRAHPSLLETIKVDAYGTKMDLRDLASINTPEPRFLVVQVWDQGNISNVEKAIRESNLSFNPSTENNIIRVPVPALSEERRKEMTKLVSEKREDAHVSIRQIRREAVDQIHKQEKSKQIAEDEKFRLSEQVQKVTDDFTNQVDTISKQKEKDILQI